MITPELYQDGFFGILFNDCPDSTYHTSVFPGKTGTMSLELGFDTAPTEAYTVLLFSTFDIVLSVNYRHEVEEVYV